VFCLRGLIPRVCCREAVCLLLVLRVQVFRRVDCRVCYPAFFQVHYRVYFQVDCPEDYQDDCRDFCQGYFRVRPRAGWLLGFRLAGYCREPGGIRVKV
jgi:hypothetical protein